MSLFQTEKERIQHYDSILHFFFNFVVKNVSSDLRTVRTYLYVLCT